ncbi:hypothetical protein EDD18DRAFT_699894 [Armillaria luteobubalina]|uniref:Acyl-protein thioesterase 1 n=1 Tax=Armillaria luteobubalina TaxID=153913 RepID=A0AA39PK56_9AGAR|nr:hypothetical protein EDD18DRAFT_699894 [Armillaria luteobubalina]
MSLFITATRPDLKISGVVMLSGRMLLPEKLAESMQTSDAKGVPIFIGHRMDDKIMTIETNGKCVDALKAAGFTVQKNTNDVRAISYHVYEGVGHTVNSREKDDLKDWMKKNLSSD